MSGLSPFMRWLVFSRHVIGESPYLCTRTKYAYRSWKRQLADVLRALVRDPRWALGLFVYVPLRAIFERTVARVLPTCAVLQPGLGLESRTTRRPHKDASFQLNPPLSMKYFSVWEYRGVHARHAVGFFGDKKQAFPWYTGSGPCAIRLQGSVKLLWEWGTSQPVETLQNGYTWISAIPYEEPFFCAPLKKRWVYNLTGIPEREWTAPYLNDRGVPSTLWLEQSFPQFFRDVRNDARQAGTARNV